MRLSDLVDTSAQVSGTRSRKQKIGYLTDCLRRFSHQEAVLGVAYLSGELPQGRIGIGPAMVRRAHAATPAGQSSLTLTDVDQVLTSIGAATGGGSAKERGRLLTELLERATESEQTFLARLILGELRQGALEGIMVEAVAETASLASTDVRRAVMLAGDVAAVAVAALSEGAPGLTQFSLSVLRPLRPMLADSAETVGEALQRLGIAALELKLDGARVQVHKSGDEVRVFSRRLNDVTAAVPEIIEAVTALPARSLILDGETIAYRHDGRPHPFQTTMRRFGRRLDVAAMRGNLPLDVVFFDCLHRDGRDLIDLPGDERFAAMADLLPPKLLVPRQVTSNVTEAEAFMERALAAGHEGIMAKAPDAPYEAGNRGSSWIKLKQVHTLDLVVLAAEWGSGRRRGWLSNLHLGARDASGGFVMLGKTFKGMTDETLQWQTQRLLELETSRDDHTVFVRPELVVEVAFNEIQTSPQYPGGLALRFARVKGYRADKKSGEADTIDTVRRLHDREGADADAAARLSNFTARRRMSKRRPIYP